MQIRQIAKTPTAQNGWGPPIANREPIAPIDAAKIPITRP